MARIKPGVISLESNASDIAINLKSENIAGPVLYIYVFSEIGDNLLIYYARNSKRFNRSHTLPCDWVGEIDQN